jgi:hypothetical protein
VGIDQRLVALHVDDDVAVEGGGDLGDTVGAGFVRGLGSRTAPPNSAVRRAMRKSSVATITRETRDAADARRYTCSIIDRPSRSARALPGSRVDA